MTLLKPCSDCDRRSRFSLCSVCFTRQTEPAAALESLTGPALAKIYIAAKERSEYFDLMTRDLWHQMKGPGTRLAASEDV